MAMTPRGSRAKLEFDPKLGAFTLAKPLLVGLTYPYDWGFIPSTKAEDGDPLDVLIIHDVATYPGLVLKCKPIGVLEIVQSSKGKQERNDRVFVVPDRSPFEGDLQDVRDHREPSKSWKILRGDGRTGIEETEIRRVARSRAGHQDDKEGRGVGPPPAGDRRPLPNIPLVRSSPFAAWRGLAPRSWTFPASAALGD
jgi:Inorganic pyrophosphatase